MKKLIKLSIGFLSILVTLTSCEDVIDIETRPGVEQLVVDAWITDEVKEQTVKLTRSQAYFDNSPPPPALGATVIVFSEDSTAYEFIDENSNGEYIYRPQNNQPLLKRIGERYVLYIGYQGEEYFSISELRPVPNIDSVSYQAFTRPIVTDTLPEAGFIAEFYARDFIEEGNTYWIRYRKNGKMKNDPTDIAISYDGAFSPGAASNGLLFISPIRQSINDFGDALYQDGDSLEIDLYAITPEAYFFLFQVRQESANAGIFATPPANIPTNIFNRNAASDKTAIGLFGVSSVSKFSTVIDKAKAKPEDL